MPLLAQAVWLAMTCVPGIDGSQLCLASGYDDPILLPAIQPELRKMESCTEPSRRAEATKAALVLSTAAAVDLWTYGYAARSGSVKEWNPLGGSPEQRVALKIAFVSMGTLSVSKISRTRPKLARGVILGLAAVEVALSVHNLRLR